MKNSKNIFIVVTLLAFVMFSVYHHIKSKSYNVLSVKSPFEIVVDLNNNGIEDDDECIKILDGYQYVSRNEVIEDNLALKYEVSNANLIAIAYQTENFVKDFLTEKVVSIKTVNSEPIIYVGNVNFNKKLLDSGYVFKEYKPVNKKAFDKNIKYINKTQFVLYNAKSNKYHKLDCKYGLMAHNYVFVPKSVLPKGAKPCKYCTGHSKGHKCHRKYKDNAKGAKSLIKPVPLSITNGAIRLFITDFTTKMKPDRNGNTEVCKVIVEQINNAKNTIDIAIYGYDKVPKVENALKNAIARGVKVRLVYDIDSQGTNIYADTMYLSRLIGNSVNDKAPADVEAPSKYTNSIMHNKFYIFDSSVVITGSANLSFTDMSGFNSNNVVVFNSKLIAQIYEKEFEQMYNARFHNLKEEIHGKENIKLGNSVVSVYFSPADSIITRVLIPLINNAKRSIDIPAFLITDKQFTQALINAKSRGVKVRVVVDATNARNPYSTHKILRQNGIPVKTETFAGKLHTKTLIVDDKYSVVGSMNFSKNGERKNDENLVVINNPIIAVFNKNFFSYLWAKIDNYWLTHDANSEGLDSPGSCSDGIDNDYDGKIDMEDEGCRILRGRYVN